MPYSSMLLHVNLNRWLHVQKISLGVFFREDSTLISIFDQFRFSFVFFWGCQKSALIAILKTPSGSISFCRAMLWMRGTSHERVSLCLSVSVCVCLSQVGVLLKRLNVGSHKQNHTIARDSSFLRPKISAKFDRGHPQRRRQMQVGWSKSATFDK